MKTICESLNEITFQHRFFKISERLTFCHRKQSLYLLSLNYQLKGIISVPQMSYDTSLWSKKQQF